MIGAAVLPLPRSLLSGARGAPRLAKTRGRPHVAPAVVRVPDPRQSPLLVSFPAGSPQIFVHEGARQALERRLAAAAHPTPVVLRLTDNRRSMINVSRSRGFLEARLHHMFLDAPAAVQAALVRYVILDDRAASVVVGRFIDEHAHRIRAHRPTATRIRAAGQVHDLLRIFHQVNDRYFGSRVDALITWGRAGHRRPRRTIKLGSYSASERLIRVHPVLDRPWVPRYFVAYVVFHEMLHHVVPAQLNGGRKELHPPAFREQERTFRDYERALAWEQKHLARLLRG